MSTSTPKESTTPKTIDEVPVGSWWTYNPDPESPYTPMVVRVESWTVYGNPRGSVDLVHYVSGFNVPKELVKPSIEGFWALVSARKLKRLDTKWTHKRVNLEHHLL